MDCLKNEPIFIEGIGVSSVSSEIMIDFWKEMISTEIGDVPGKGYMIHRMWRKYKYLEPTKEWGEWSSVREMSFNFGWKGYSHDYFFLKLPNLHYILLNSKDKPFFYILNYY